LEGDHSGAWHLLDSRPSLRVLCDGCCHRFPIRGGFDVSFDSIRFSMTHLNSKGVNELHLNCCFRVFGSVLSQPPVPVPFVENPMNLINLLTFLSGSVSGGRSSIWESSQLATFGDEIPLDELYDVTPSTSFGGL
jgi:hypothetical protein